MFPVTASSGGLKWVRVNMPKYRIPGEEAQLHCDYKLGNDTLYSVKWYKDHEEFYRFVPRARPEASSYEVDGVHVDVSTTGHGNEYWQEFSADYGIVEFNFDL